MSDAESTNHLLPDASGLLGLIALALACVAALVWGMARWDAHARVPTVARAAPGTFVRVPLSDGSTVLLRGGATLRYPRRFSGVRAVAVAGDAYVRARRDAVPFVVTTAEGTLTTLGARFDVRADSGRTRVAVERGTVQLAPRTAPQSASVLGPGSVRDLRAGGIAEAPAGLSVADVEAWRVPLGQP